ncbi:MAG TPA: 2-dehydropantoate 2-reductase [Firmicutes bacterium]|nr:2-dehydropantoate 2-reductase [Bacillota bacterium]
MKIAIAGVGGVGGLLAGAMQLAGEEPYFIVRGKNKEAIQERGLKLVSDTLGQVTVRPQMAQETAVGMGEMDVVFLCTKSYGLDDMCRICQPLVGRDTLVIPLLNGVAVAQDVRQRLGEKGRVADGCIYCFSALDRPGVVRHTGQMKKVVFGFPGQEMGEMEKELCHLLEQGGMEVECTGQVLERVWEKYHMMCGNSALFAWFDVSAGGIQQDPEKMAFARKVYEELVTIAASCGVVLPDDLVERHLAALRSFLPGTTSSLYRDLKTPGAKTEWEAIVGKAVRLARENGVQAPCMTAIYEKYAGR